MKKIFTLFFLSCSLSFKAFCQTPAIPQTMPFGKIDMADLQMKQCDFEKDANAMVLFDKADVYFDQDFNIVMDRHKRIKIFNDKGKDEANIRIPFWGGNRLESISDIQVETINENNGKPEITKLEKKLIYTENIDKSRTAIVFAFPNVRAGSVIEFKYHWQTPAYYNMPSWYFQGTIPSRYSEIKTEIPDFFYFKTQTRLHGPFDKNTTSSQSKTIGNGQDAYAYSTDDHVRALANIPSLNDEPFMRSRTDNLACIYFQLTTVKPIGGFVRSYNDTWAKVGGTLAEDEDFGGQLKRRLKDEDVILTKAKTLKTDDEKIAYIFAQVRDRMKWNEDDRWYTNDGTSKAWEKQTGNSTEINLSLYHLLKQAGIHAYPMLVSTRENGRVSGAYPSLNQFNRAVAYIPVDSTKSYVLDASDKYNVYNDTPDELLNSTGLYIDKDEKRFDLLFLERQVPVRRVVSVNANVLPDGKLEGLAEINSFSYYKQQSVRRYKTDGEDKYKKLLKEGDNNLDISSLKMENMDVDTLPLTQKIAFKLALSGSDDNYIYINPNLFTSLRTNPFLSENRATDIDLGFKSNCIINGNYKIPAGYKTDAIPKSINMVMPDRSITFRRIVVEEDGMVKLNYSISYKKTIYYKESYAELREFYKKMHDMLNEQIVLKKG